MAIQTQEQMKHSHLKNYTAAARATASRVLGRRLAWQWLVAAAGGAPAMSYGILAAHEMQWSTMSQLARVVELLLQLPQQAPAARLCCHVLRSCLVGAALIACADKAEGTHGQW